MAKILLINPTVREEDVPRHVPYGIALLAAIAMHYQDTIMALLQKLQDIIRAGRVSI